MILESGWSLAFSKLLVQSTGPALTHSSEKIDCLQDSLGRAYGRFILPEPSTTGTVLVQFLMASQPLGLFLWLKAGELVPFLAFKPLGFKLPIGFCS